MKNKEEKWKNLNPEQYKILREKGTEPAFSGFYLNNKANGKYYCAGCGNYLFDSHSKYDSGSGWPSFHTPGLEDSIICETDYSFNMVRTEIKCSKCNSHLGHLFDDGPLPTGRRYCVNSLSLQFIKSEE